MEIAKDMKKDVLITITVSYTHLRQAAGRFAISKSTVHKDISQRLEKLSPSLHQQVRQVLERNKQERHIRGGMATKEKYEQLRKANAEK